MDRIQFSQVIMDFVQFDYPVKVGVKFIEFTIRFGNTDDGYGITFGGHYVLDNDKFLPIDLRKIGKQKCHELCNSIQRIYKESKCNNIERYNVIEMKIYSIANIQYELKWDDTLDECENNLN